jgi:hypothetical protein
VDDKSVSSGGAVSEILRGDGAADEQAIGNHSQVVWGSQFPAHTSGKWGVMTYLKLPHLRRLNWWKNCSPEDAEWLLKNLPRHFRPQALSLAKKAPILVQSGIIDKVELDFLAEDVAEEQAIALQQGNIINEEQSVIVANPEASSSDAPNIVPTLVLQDPKNHTE